MKIFDPKKGGELVLPHQAIPGDRGEVNYHVVLTLPPGELVKTELESEAGQPSLTSILLKGVGTGKAQLVPVTSMELTAVIVIESSTERPEKDDLILSLDSIRRFNADISNVPWGGWELRIESYDHIESYSNFVYRTMKT